MTEIFNLEEGVKEAIVRLEAVTERPVLASIYGQPNSGKTFIIHEIGNYFDSKGLFACRFSGAANEDILKGFNLPERNGLIYLFHFAWERYTDHPSLLMKDDPERILERKMHLNIGIFNPNLDKQIKGDYDLIISNINSVKKR